MLAERNWLLAAPQLQRSWAFVVCSPSGSAAAVVEWVWGVRGVVGAHGSEEAVARFVVAAAGACFACCAAGAHLSGEQAACSVMLFSAGSQTTADLGHL